MLREKLSTTGISRYRKKLKFAIDAGRRDYEFSEITSRIHHGISRLAMSRA